MEHVTGEHDFGSLNPSSPQDRSRKQGLLLKAQDDKNLPTCPSPRSQDHNCNLPHLGMQLLCRRFCRRNLWDRSALHWCGRGGRRRHFANFRFAGQHVTPAANNTEALLNAASGSHPSCCQRAPRKTTNPHCDPGKTTRTRLTCEGAHKEFAAPGTGETLHQEPASFAEAHTTSKRTESLCNRERNRDTDNPKDSPTCEDRTQAERATTRKQGETH